MENTITLKAEGYTVAFTLKTVKNVRTSLDLTAVFSLNPRIGKVEAASQTMLIRLQDIERLAAYLEEHMARLREDPDSQSYIFVPLDMQFEMQAFAGEVRGPDDGEFSLRFMVNVGQQDSESTAVYVGGETVVTVENIQNFIAALRRVLAEMP
jgi:hypothetical protein